MAFAEWFALFETEEKAGNDLTSVLMPPLAGNNAAISVPIKSRPSINAGGSAPPTTHGAAPLPPPVAVVAPPIEVLFLKDIRLEVFDWQLGGDAPSDLTVLESVQAILSKYVQPH